VRWRFSAPSSQRQGHKDKFEEAVLFVNKKNQKNFDPPGPAAFAPRRLTPSFPRKRQSSYPKNRLFAPARPNSTDQSLKTFFGYFFSKK
jgi:hypothetical protein